MQANHPILRLAMAQIDVTVGKFQDNVQQILLAAQQASDQGARILVLPELVLCGYLPEDLLWRSDFIIRQNQALQTLSEGLKAYPDLYVLVGHIAQKDGAFYNEASLYLGGDFVASYTKHCLPNYAVFDEKRYFTAGQDYLCFEVAGHRFGVAICEDIWLSEVAQAYAQKGVQTLLVMNASPFAMGKQAQRLERVHKHITALGMNAVYTNLLGAQDELVFDGNSFVLDKQGNCVLTLADCRASMGIVDYDTVQDTWTQGSEIPFEAEGIAPEDQSVEACLWRALCLATRDYVHKTGFKNIVLGLSGGIDSAVVLAIACDALGADHCQAVMMPSRYTADISVNDAQDMAKRLGVRYHEIAIAPMMQSFDTALAPIFAGLPVDTTEENLQARIRGNLLMALSNKFSALVLSTGNKSELATGYCTLYGDMVGAYAVLKDVYKTMVYRLAVWRNTISEVIPERIITRPPSAELRDNQTDQDSLPDYDTLDCILKALIEDQESSQTIIDQGFSEEAVLKVARLLRINEYKRRQGALGPRLSSRAFGKDWRYPLAHGFHY